MKDSAWYNKLWQTKMQELPLEGDEHTMWQNMQSLLDENMPVSNPVVTPKPATSLWVKLIYIMAVIITAAVVYYAASHLLASHHEKTNRPAGKHALMNRDSTNSKYSAKIRSNDDKLKADADNNAGNNEAADKNNDKKTATASSEITGASSAMLNSKLTAGAVNKGDIKHAGNNPSGTKITLPANNNNAPVAPHSAMTGNHPYTSHDTKHNNNAPSSRSKTTSANNHLSGTGYTAVNGTAHHNKLSGHSTSGGRHSVPTNPHPGFYAYNSQNQRTGNRTNHSSYLNSTGKNRHLSKTDQHPLAGQTTSEQTNVNPVDNGGTTNDTAIKDASQSIKLTANKTDSTITAKNTDAKQTADTKTKNQSDKSVTKSKVASAKKSGNSKFEVDVKLGANTNTGSTINPFLGISANYNFNKKWGVAVGVNAPYTRIVAGSYSKTNLTYVTVGDSNKQITHNSGKLMISSSRKIKYVDIPVLATYKVSDRFTVTAGPVISIPIKANASKNTLGALSSSADTTTLKEATSYVTGTSINSKVNFSVSAGARYTIKRFYFDAGYLQGISPYTVSSSLGSGKIYYHTVQIGIGYQLFKSKSK